MQLKSIGVFQLIVAHWQDNKIVFFPNKTLHYCVFSSETLKFKINRPPQILHQKNTEFFYLEFYNRDQQ